MTTTIGEQVDFIMQEDIMINQYFCKIKTLCCEIVKLYSDCNIPKKCMKRIVTQRLMLDIKTLLLLYKIG